MVKGELAYLIGYPAITRLEVDLDHTISASSCTKRKEVNDNYL